MSTPQSMLDALRSDHRVIADELADSASLGATHDALVAREQLVMRLVGHYVAEEQYLYPSVREHVDEGHAKADPAFAADRHSEQQLRALEDADLSPEQLATIWGAIGREFTAHVATQETLFTELEAACSPAQLAELGEGVIGAEQLAPTRPRRLAPEWSGANKFVSFFEGYLDRARDYYTKRGVEDDTTY